MTAYISTNLKTYVWTMAIGMVVMIVVLVVVIFPSDHEDDYETLQARVATTYDGSINDYEINETPDHIGENARVHGKVYKVFTSKTNTTFVDFCNEFSSCSFSAVVFSSDVKKFDDLKYFEGKDVVISGILKSYNGRAEIILSDPEQMKIDDDLI